MKLTKQQLYGLLFVAYLARAGRATTGAVAQELGISKNFLERIALTLRKKGLTKSIRGVNGGHELDPRANVILVLAALGYKPMLHPDTIAAMKLGPHEKRVVAKLAHDVTGLVFKALTVTISSLVNSHAAAEAHLLDQVNPNAIVN